eukprot:2145848-Rhodomonas_salina.1
MPVLRRSRRQSPAWRPAPCPQTPAHVTQSRAQVHGVRVRKWREEGGGRREEERREEGRRELRESEGHGEVGEGG